MKMKFLSKPQTKILLTWVKSRKQLAALGVLIYIKNNKYETNLYTKPTDAPLYVHWTSAQPKHLKESIPFGQFLRLRRIVSEDCNFYLELNFTKGATLTKL